MNTAIASSERLHAMAKAIIKADKIDDDWGNDLYWRALINLSKEEQLTLQRIINESTSSIPGQTSPTAD